MLDAKRHAALASAVALGAGFGLAMGGAFAAADVSPQARVDAAYAAMGGDRLAALKTVSFKAHMVQYDPGESYSVADPDKPGVGTAELSESRDLEHGLTRNEWTRPKVDDGTVRRYTEIVTPEAGYSIGNDAATGRLPKRSTSGDRPEHGWSGPRLTLTLRELERGTIVQEAKAHPDRVSAAPDQKAGGKTYPAVTVKGEHGTFLILFDPATHLPARVRTRDWDALEGDSDFDAAYSDWRDVEGAKLPFHTAYSLNAFKISDITLSDVKGNVAIPAADFTIPAAMLAQAEKPAPLDKTPTQWIVRRQYSGFYLDSSSYYMDDGGRMSLVDIAPNVSQTQGATHNTLFIDTGAYLIAVEAPNDDGQAKMALALEKQKYGDKPIKYLILTHHHVDHVGGMRSFAALGATIVVGPGDGAYFREVLARTENLNPNAPANAFTPKVIEVSGKWSVNDGGREVDAYPFENPHAADMLMVYVPEDKLGIVTDLWNPGPPVTASNPGVASVIHGVDKWGLKLDRMAGGHGTIAPYAQAEMVVKAADKAK